MRSPPRELPDYKLRAGRLGPPVTPGISRRLARALILAVLAASRLTQPQDPPKAPQRSTEELLQSRSAACSREVCPRAQRWGLELGGVLALVASALWGLDEPV